MVGKLCSLNLTPARYCERFFFYELECPAYIRSLFRVIPDNIRTLFEQN